MVGVLLRRKDLGGQSLYLCLVNPRPTPLSPECAIRGAIREV